MSTLLLDASTQVAETAESKGVVGNRAGNNGVVNKSVAIQDGFQAYLNQVNAIPSLSREQEIDLFERFQQQDDLKAARELVMSHLRYVAYIAKSYSGYGLAMEDIVQQGNLGLMKSVKRFDLSHGVRLATFAIHWIKAEIHEFILKNWRIVKVATTKAQRKLFFNLRSKKKHLGWLTSSEAKDVAKGLNVEVKDVVEMESRLQNQDAFFDASFGDSNSESDVEPQSAKALYLEDQSWSPENLVADDQEQKVQLQAMHEALATLDERSLDIIKSRWLGEEKMGLKELAERHGVSLERIRQIEKKALETMKRTISVAA